jgi:hypothetical protein
LLLLSASIALAGTENYDYKAKAPPPPQPWCETPPILEIRIGVPGWLAGVSGDIDYQGGDLSILDNGDARLVISSSTTGNPQEVGLLRFDGLGRSKAVVIPS